jgi:hypothetical protein
VGVKLSSRPSQILLGLSRRRDDVSRRVGLQRGLQALASLWIDRAGLEKYQIAVGVKSDQPVPAVLLGLRLGTCQLEVPCAIANVDATASVTHDVLRGRELRVVLRPRVPLQVDRWPSSPEFLASVRHLEASTGPPCLIDGISIGQLAHDDDLDPYMVGTAELVEFGDRSVLSSRWLGHVLGAFTSTEEWRGQLAGANVSIDVYPPAPRWSGLGALARDARLGQVRHLAEWATWRRAELAHDFARLLRVKLDFPKPVTALEAEGFLLDHVCRLLHLFSGTRATLCGLWDAEERIGRLLDLGRSLIAERRKIVDPMVTMAAFLEEVAPVWDALSDAEKKVVKVGMDALAAMPADLEPAVVAGSMNLEFLAASLLPKATNSYSLTKKQRTDIKKGLAAVAAQVAPRSEWQQDLPRIESRLFQAPAGDRIGELVSVFGVHADTSELNAYSRVRNAITHGRPAEASIEDKVTAMLFERYTCGLVLLRKVGYTGRLRDDRYGQLRGDRPGSRVK